MEPAPTQLLWAEVLIARFVVQEVDFSDRRWPAIRTIVKDFKYIISLTNHPFDNSTELLRVCATHVSTMIERVGAG